MIAVRTGLRQDLIEPSSLAAQMDAHIVGTRKPRERTGPDSGANRTAVHPLIHAVSNLACAGSFQEGSVIACLTSFASINHVLRNSKIGDCASRLLWT